MSQLTKDNPAIEKIEDNIRRDIITSFREWLDKPETKIEGVERFWEYKSRLLLFEIDRLSARCEESSRVVEQDINPTPTDKEVVELNANLSALLSAVEPFEKWQERQGFDERMDECSIDPDNGEELTFGDFRRLSTVAAGIRGKG